MEGIEEGMEGTELRPNSNEESPIDLDRSIRATLTFWCEHRNSSLSGQEERLATRSNDAVSTGSCGSVGNWSKGLGSVGSIAAAGFESGTS